MTRHRDAAKEEVRTRKPLAGRGRTLALVAVAVALGSAVAAAPVSAHVSGGVAHLWNDHLKARTDARYYTKAQGEARYYNVGETVAQAANAGQLDGIDSTGFLGVGAKAADSDTLDGIDSSGFLGVNGKAANSDKLDGIDSAGFVQGGGSTERSYFSEASGSARQRTPVGELLLLCYSGRATVDFVNQTEGPVSLWSQRASTGEINFQTVKSSDLPLRLYLNQATVAAERITLQASTATRSETFDAWIVANGSTCTFNLIRSGD